MSRKGYVIIAVIVAAAVPLAILLHTVLANYPPVITSLKVEAERVFPSGSTQIVCTASNRNGGELTYDWWTSGGNITGMGPKVIWTAPDSEGTYTVSVTVTDGRGGDATDYITIRVEANKPPEIDSLTADATWTLPSGSIQVACNASDPDGDELSYEWSTTGGGISGTDAVVKWTAPGEVGSYNITVVVTDGHGGTATETLPVSVVTGQPPVIEALLITKDRHEHCYLRERSRLVLVGREQKYDIECIAYHPDGFELSYEWDCDDGEISGISEDGSMITWKAPNTSVDVTVTVTVSDTAGNTVSDSMPLNVVSCSVCTFGSC